MLRSSAGRRKKRDAYVIAIEMLMMESGWGIRSGNVW